MATPVPVVSMMYFLVFSPPKTFIMVSPASFALSVKYAMGLEFLEFWLAGLPTTKSNESGRRAASRICSEGIEARRSEQVPEIMSHGHSRVRLDGGQEAARTTCCLARATILMKKQIMNSGVIFRRFLCERVVAKALLRRLLVVFLLPWILLAQNSASQEKRQAAQADEAYAKGISALQQGDVASAQAAFESVVRMAPNSAEGHNSLGWVFLAQEQTDFAIRQFRAALRLKPDFAQAHINLANAFLRKANTQSALRESREAVRLAPKDSEAHRTLARALDFSRDVNEYFGSFLALHSQKSEGCMLFSAVYHLQPNFRSDYFQLSVLRF